MDSIRHLATRFALTAGLAGTLAACGGIPPSAPIADIVARSEGKGANAAEISQALRQQRTSYALRGSDFGKLAAAGVPDAVLDQIQQTFINEVDLLVRYWMNGESMGRCGPCYPQQVDLTGIENGATPKTFPPPMQPMFSRPLGLPDWYRRIAASLTGITLDDVRADVRAGRSADDIVARLRRSRLNGLIATGGVGNLQLNTRLVAYLTGSQLAKMRADGVPDAVLDELQVRYLAEVVEHSRIRYIGDGKGSMP
ncbi:MAG: hypothetical protein KIT73_13120 [Burkholderiales bacterium]|nr:hypothetical protein [Burkholderiales bacterium]